MSSADTLAPSTHSVRHKQKVSRVFDMMTADEAVNPVPRYYLVGSVKDHPVELPEEIYQAVRHVVDAMQRGMSVVVTPTSQMLTTQQAADLLGISRPTLIKALDGEKLPFTRSGTHRRIALTDVLEYREKRRQEQYAAIEATSVDVDESTDIAETLADLRAARKAVAAKRRAG